MYKILGKVIKEGGSI